MSGIAECCSIWLQRDWIRSIGKHSHAASAARGARIAKGTPQTHAGANAVVISTRLPKTTRRSGSGARRKFPSCRAR